MAGGDACGPLELLPVGKHVVDVYNSSHGGGLRFVETGKFCQDATAQDACEHVD